MSERRHTGLLVVPENNTTMEPEMNALCPDFAPFVVARVKRPARRTSSCTGSARASVKAK